MIYGPWKFPLPHSSQSSHIPLILHIHCLANGCSTLWDAKTKSVVGHWVSSPSVGTLEHFYLFIVIWSNLMRVLVSHRISRISSKVVWQCRSVLLHSVVDLQRPSLCCTWNWSRQALVNRCNLAGVGREWKLEEGMYGVLTDNSFSTNTPTKKKCTFT